VLENHKNIHMYNEYYWLNLKTDICSRTYLNGNE